MSEIKDMSECDAERTLWARLVRATMAGRAAVLAQGPYGDALARADRDAEAASQALRDIGVDVDALLGEP